HVCVAGGARIAPSLNVQCVRARRGGHRGIDGGAVDESVVAAAVERKTHRAHRLAGACTVRGGKGKLRGNHSAVGGVVDDDLGPSGKRAKTPHGEDEGELLENVHSYLSVSWVWVCLRDSERGESDFAAQQPIPQVAHLSP